MFVVIVPGSYQFKLFVLGNVSKQRRSQNTTYSPIVEIYGLPIWIISRVKSSSCLVEFVTENELHSLPRVVVGWLGVN